MSLFWDELPLPIPPFLYLAPSRRTCFVPIRELDTPLTVPQTLRSATAVGGIKKFLNKLLSDAHDDTWILTMQDALDWIQSPIPISELGSSDTWACPDRNFHACNMDSDDEESRRKAKNMESPFRSLIFVDSLWIYQIVFLVFAYLVLLRHDSRQNK